MDWSRWAQFALRKMSQPDWECRDADKDRNGGVEGARSALESIAETGHEPYYILKAFVVLNNLEERKERK